MKKSSFLTFCFSFIPGAGQMYQEYSKRGLSIMTIFIAFIAIEILVDIPIFALPLPIIYAFSFFDTFNLRNKIGTDRQVEDDYIWNNKEIKSTISNIKISKKNKVVGIILIILGVYILFNNVFVNIASVYGIRWLEYTCKYVLRYLPPIIISLLSIMIGLKFISGDRK